MTELDHNYQSVSPKFCRFNRLINNQKSQISTLATITTKINQSSEAHKTRSKTPKFTKTN